MLSRRRVYLETIDPETAPAASRELEAEGCVVVPGALSSDEVDELRASIDAVYDSVPADVRNPTRPAEQLEDYRYEMLNRSEVVQRLVADRRILDIVEPLLGEDCHVIANTAWRNPPRGGDAGGGGFWHTDAGPHIPRPAGVPWDDRIPYPFFAVALHVMLDDCPIESGPTEVVPGSHRSGRPVPVDRLIDPDLDCGGVRGRVLPADAGDLVMFSSDAWHRRHPPTDADPGRSFLQVHYGRRDIAQRLRLAVDVNHLSPEASARAQAGSDRDRTVVGLHHQSFYDG